MNDSKKMEKVPVDVLCSNLASVLIVQNPHLNKTSMMLVMLLRATPTTAAKMMCGAPSATMPATAETQEVADQVKSQLESKENQKFDVFKAISFKRQIVAGTNLFIKVDVGGDKCVHLRVFQPLPHENKPLTLSSYQTNKERHDELSYF